MGKLDHAKKIHGMGHFYNEVARSLYACKRALMSCPIN